MYKKLKTSFPKYTSHFKFYLSSFFDKVSYWLSSKNDSIWSGNNKPNYIVFITEDPRIGIIRYLQTLKRAYNITVDIILPHGNLDDLFLKAGFDKVHFFRNHWHFRKILSKQRNVDLIHGFIRRSFITKIAIEEYDAPVVVSAKDISMSSFGVNPKQWYLKEELPAEKFTLENADGILAESLEPCLAAREYKLIHKPPRIYFPEYCEDDKVLPISKKISGTDLHLVYAGAVRGKQDNSKIHGNIQLHWLIESLNRQKIHLHVYPNPRMDKAVYQEYFSISKNLLYFHMHHSLPPDKLNKEISQYHYALIPFFNEDTQRSPLKRYYSSSLKIFAYMEAGLPALISNDMGHQRWIAERYNCALGLKKKDFYDVEGFLSNIEYDSLLKKLDLGRKQLLLNAQIHRAYEFYNKVIQEKKTDKK